MTTRQWLGFLIITGALAYLIAFTPHPDPAPNHPNADRDNDGIENTQDWKPGCPSHYDPDRPDHFNFLGRGECDEPQSKSGDVTAAIERGQGE